MLSDRGTADLMQSSKCGVSFRGDQEQTDDVCLLFFADKNINESKQNTPKNVLDSIIAEQLSMFKPSEKENSIVNKKSEGEAKLQNYIKSRLAEKRAGRKSTILESKKSETLKKLDEMIDREYLKYEKTSKRN